MLSANDLESSRYSPPSTCAWLLRYGLLDLLDGQVKSIAGK